jgi:hypothetical protein
VKVAAFAFIFIANLATASVELIGVSIASSDSRFILADDSTGATSRWLKVGDSFHGCNIVSFDAKREVLDVKSGASTLHLHLRSPAKVLDSPPDPEEKQLQLRAAAGRARMLAFDFAYYDDLILADVTVDGSYVIITPREVWKGSKFTAGTPVTIPRDPFMGGFSSGLFILAYRPGSPYGPDSPTMAQPTDGLTAGGTPAGTPLDDFRAYKNGANQLPDPTSPSVTPPAKAGGAPSVAADH